MLGRMDRMSQHLEAVRSDLWKEIGIKVGNTILGLKRQILVEVGKKFAMLESRIEVKLNDNR